MLLLAEIILTIFDWRKGYKWLSLLPVGVGLITGFILGAGIAASGGMLLLQEVFPYSLIF